MRGMTSEQRDAIESLAASGLSRAQIADRIGVTKGMVHGHLTRAAAGSARPDRKLSEEEKRMIAEHAARGSYCNTIAATIGRTPATVRGYCIRARIELAVWQPPAPAATRPPTPPRVVSATWTPPIGSRTLLQLEAHACRWPLNDPKTDGSADWMFCGAVRVGEGTPYCAHHWRMGRSATVTTCADRRAA